jgi:hypothetical protein
VLGLQVGEHLPPMLDLGRRQSRDRPRSREQRQLAGSHAVALAPEALKTEHVLAIGADVAAILELRLAFPALGAQVSV